MLSILKKKKIIHFINVDGPSTTLLKNSIKKAYSEHSNIDEYLVLFHEENIALRDIPKGEKVIFSLQNPISRFVSSFNYLKNEFLDNGYCRWTSEEAIAFKSFNSANHLAEMLSSQEKTQLVTAHNAMTAVSCISGSYLDYFESEDYFMSRFPDILYICFNESLEKDFLCLKKILHLPEQTELALNDGQLSIETDAYSAQLSKDSKKNLTSWYQTDWDFFVLCQGKSIDITKSLIRRNFELEKPSILKSTYRKAKPTIFKQYQKLRGKQIVHFIHIEKTGGSALKTALKTSMEEALLSYCFINDKYTVFFHKHDITLRNIPRGEKVIFTLRDPVSRFVSGFYQRRKQELSKYNDWPWTPEEADAFERFYTADDLAISLSSKDNSIKEAAHKAMASIGHVNNSYLDYFESNQYFLSRLSDILFVCFQETLDEDFECLKEILCLSKDSFLPFDDKKANKRPITYTSKVSEDSIRNLTLWYRKDFSFMALCRANANVSKEVSV